MEIQDLCIYTHKALHTLCKRVRNGFKTLFGLGDWNEQDDGIMKRRSVTALKRFCKAMGVHAYVQMLDGFRTSN